jgi:hypothetical protein
VKFGALEMKVGYGARCGLMNYDMFGGKALRKVQDAGLGGGNIGCRFDPDSLAESISSPDVIRRNLHAHPSGENEVSEQGKWGKSGKYLH